MRRFPALLAGALLGALTTSPLLASWDEGVSAFRSGRWDEAAAAFEAFVSQNPQAADGHYMLGLSRLQQRRSAEALASLDRAVELGSGEIRFSLALAQAQLKARPGEAALSTLAALDPSAVPVADRATYHQLLARAAVASPRDAAADAGLRRPWRRTRRRKTCGWRWPT